MILLKNSTDILQLYSSVAVPVEISVNYIDLNQQTRIQEPGRLSVVITSTGITNVLSGRGEYGIYRAIKQLSIFNGDDTNSTSIELRHSGLHENETSPRIVTQYATLLTKNQTIQYTTGQGFYNQGQFDQGNSQLNTDGTGDVEKFPRFVDANTVEGLTADELKTLLGIGGIDRDPVTGDYTFNGSIIFEPASVPYVLDLGGGSIENGTIDSGLIQ